LSTCAQCGETVSVAEDKFCDSCGAPVAPLEASAGAFAPTVQAAPAFQAPTPPTRPMSPPSNSSDARMTSIPPSLPFSLAHGEVLMAKYTLSHSRRPLGRVDGELFVTDARVVYRAEASNLLNRSLIAEELQIADIAGFRLLQRRGLSPVASVVALLIFIVSLFIGPAAFIPVIILVVLWAAVSWRSSELVFVIQARQLPTAGLSISGGNQRVSGMFVQVWRDPGGSVRPL
jgi:hypothetical protein